MPELVITASIIQESPSHFTIVVSSAPAVPDGGTQTDIEIADALTRADADKMMSKLIGTVVDRAERRGDKVMRVRRVLPERSPVRDREA